MFVIISEGKQDEGRCGYATMLIILYLLSSSEKIGQDTRSRLHEDRLRGYDGLGDGIEKHVMPAKAGIQRRNEALTKMY